MISLVNIVIALSLTFVSVWSQTLIPTSLPTNPPVFTAKPSLQPAISPYPTYSPTGVTATVVSFTTTFPISLSSSPSPPSRKMKSVNINKDITIDMSSISLEAYRPLNPSNSVIFTIEEALAAAQGVPTEYVDYIYGYYTSLTIISVNCTTSVPLTGEFAGYDTTSLYNTLVSNMNTAISNGDATNYLQQAASVNDDDSIFSTASFLAVTSVSNPSTDVYNSFDDDDAIKISDGDITAIVICSIIGVCLLTFGMINLYVYYNKMTIKNTETIADEEDIETTSVIVGNEKQPPVDISVRYEQAYPTTSAGDVNVQDSPRGMEKRRESLRGITPDAVANDA